MISEDFVTMLVCPETRQSLKLLPEQIVARCNERIAAGEVSNRAGVKLKDPISGLLEREDGVLAYQIRENIPIMLTEEAVCASCYGDE